MIFRPAVLQCSWGFSDLSLPFSLEQHFMLPIISIDHTWDAWCPVIWGRQAKDVSILFPKVGFTIMGYKLRSEKILCCGQDSSFPERPLRKHGMFFHLLCPLLTWTGKEPACQYKRFGFSPWVGKIPWRRAWQPTPVLLPGESHVQRSLAG